MARTTCRTRNEGHFWCRGSGGGGVPWSPPSLKGRADKLGAARRTQGTRGVWPVSAAQVSKGSPLAQEVKSMDTRGGGRTQIRWHGNWGLGEEGSPACRGGGAHPGERKTVRLHFL